MIVIQAKNNNETTWATGAATISFFISLLVAIKDIGLITVFLIRVYIEHRDGVFLRPQSYGQMQETPKLDKSSLLSMKAYLLEGSTVEVDESGNTEMHEIVKESQDTEKAQLVV